MISKFAVVFEAIKQLMEPPAISRNPIGFQLSNVKPEDDMKAAHTAACSTRLGKRNKSTKKSDRIKKK